MKPFLMLFKLVLASLVAVGESSCDLIEAINRSQYNATSEVYLQRNNPLGACFGVVDYEIFIPSGDDLQQPFTVQDMFENQLQYAFEKIPKWLDATCYIALKTYMCSSVLKPSVHVIIENETVFVPSYPYRSICENYYTTCHAFFSKGDLSRLRNISELLIPQCDAKVNCVEQYPYDNQTVLRLKDEYGVVLNLSSSPNDLADVDNNVFSEYESKCPGSFVVPDDPDNPFIKLISASGCALPCISNTYTEEEWKASRTISATVGLVGITLLLFVIFTYMCDEKRRSGYWLVIYILCIMVCIDGINVIPRVLMSDQDLFCHDNAVPRMQDHGLTFCTFSAGFTFFFIVARNFGIMLQVIFLYCKIVLGYQMDLSFNLKCFIILLTLLPPLYINYRIIIVDKVLGFSGNTPFCFVTADKRNTGAAFAVPVFFMAMVVIFCLLFIFLKIISILHLKSGSSWESFKMLKPIVFWSCGFLAIFLYGTIPWVLYASRVDELEIAKNKWIDCIFLNNYAVDVVDSNTAIEICGEHVKDRADGGLLLYSVTTGVYSLLYGLMDLRVSIKYWFKRSFNIFSSQTRVSDVSIESNKRSSQPIESTQMFVAVSHFELCEEDEHENLYPLYNGESSNSNGNSSSRGSSNGNSMHLREDYLKGASDSRTCWDDAPPDKNIVQGSAPQESDVVIFSSVDC